MSHHIAIPNSEKFDPKKGAPIKTIFQGMAAAGLVGSLLTLIIDREHFGMLFAHSWLFAFFFAFTVLIGAFFWNCLHHATDSEWSVVVRRQMENVAALLRIVGLIFVPIALICVLKPQLLYVWFVAGPEDTLLAGTKSWYLNKPSFWGRAVAIFFLLFWLPGIMRRRSMAQDADGLAKHTIIMRRAAVAGIPTLALCLTFGGIDWLKALNHHWFSTMWGVYLFAGAAGSSMAVLILICKWLKSLGYLQPVTNEHFHTMGKFLFAFTVFWGYIGYSQYMLITYANIDEETLYFRVRNTESWGILSHCLVFGRFFMMFIPLLFQGTKKSKGIIFCASWVVLMQCLDLFLIIIPEYAPGGISLAGLFGCACTLITVVGVLGIAFLRNLGEGYIFPTKDPRLAESLKLTN
jgi:hypothetical protein